MLINTFWFERRKKGLSIIVGRVQILWTWLWPLRVRVLRRRG